MWQISFHWKHISFDPQILFYRTANVLENYLKIFFFSLSMTCFHICLFYFSGLFSKNIRCDMKWYSKKRVKWHCHCWRIRTIWNEFQHVHKGLLTSNEEKKNYLLHKIWNAFDVLMASHCKLLSIFPQFSVRFLDIFMVRLMELPLHWPLHYQTNMECLN